MPGGCTTLGSSTGPVVCVPLFLSAQLGTHSFLGTQGPVHITSGISSFVISWFVGPRRGYGTTKLDYRPQSSYMVVLGTAFLFYGWCGFNGASMSALNLKRCVGSGSSSHLFWQLHSLVLRSSSVAPVSFASQTHSLRARPVLSAGSPSTSSTLAATRPWAWLPAFLAVSSGTSILHSNCYTQDGLHGSVYCCYPALLTSAFSMCE